MSNRTPRSRAGASKHPTSTRQKKTKAKKTRQGAKYLREETPQASPQEVSQRALGGITRLGSQIFALSPFSQYYDDWLINLRQVVGEFESTPAIKVDETFQKAREQIFLDVEAALAEQRIAESHLSEEAKALADNNHKIAEADKEYAEQTRDLSNKRNSDIQRLSNKVRMLEDDLAAQEGVKLGFFKFKEKRLAAEKLAKTNQDLSAAKNELEVITSNFKAEQDKLHDNYEKHKQELFETSDRLHKELEKLETDSSAQPRQTACNALTQAINALLQRCPPS
ncbi:MAG: hypothetical protein NWE93_02400 [Candidatus Bathyarchaeota archaeon]|nr:hypothetical protein [Candidatus Bathyarchaeota archaeon]